MKNYTVQSLIVSFFLVLICTTGVFAQTKIAVIGSWYDDLGSPNYGNANLIIEKEGGKYFIRRQSGDGSIGRYLLSKSGNIYTKVGDKFGANYVVTIAGLEIRDKRGYIRMARINTQ